jgi:hypothetical protein
MITADRSSIGILSLRAGNETEPIGPNLPNGRTIDRG